MERTTPTPPTLKKEKEICFFGQVIVGAPGSGKTTYCQHMQQRLTQLGRKTVVVNLDPATSLQQQHHPHSSTTTVMGIHHFVMHLDQVMEKYGLGPNGGLTFCLEILEQHKETFLGELLRQDPETYFLFDCPGQLELYTHHSSMKNIFHFLTQHGFKLCTIQLMDALHCLDPNKYMAGLLSTLAMMMQLELPHLNFLSKFDLLLSQEHELAFPLEYYTEVQSLSPLLSLVFPSPLHENEEKENHRSRSFRSFSTKLCDLVEDYGLVHFLPLTWKDEDSQETFLQLLQTMDQANGYYYSSSSWVSSSKSVKTSSSSPPKEEEDMYSKMEQWQVEVMGSCSSKEREN
ncbi:GPN-loop GTPase 2 [Coelomomyces lativittatus]|nr:GPN-loop GTPase 2 [Coelomomyces lativittatus]KAJ1510724.1 GPN-loop GTPase 2 [Coelomomyces lativittatus]KAJ1511412.1 GPN-loop GTPase 2 [Coelomomyces lativittatus]